MMPANQHHVIQVWAVIAMVTMLIVGSVIAYVMSRHNNRLQADAIAARHQAGMAKRNDALTERCTLGDRFPPSHHVGKHAPIIQTRLVAAERNDESFVVADLSAA